MFNDSMALSGCDRVSILLNGENVGGYGRYEGQSDDDFCDEVNMCVAFITRENGGEGAVTVKLE